MNRPTAAIGTYRGVRSWLPWTALALGLVLIHGLSFRFVIDDAFISFRFAQNLIDGHGLVFNPGEPVEGYSNLLWVLLAALGMKLGVPALLWARILGTLAVGAMLALVPRILDRLVPEASARSAWPGRAAQLILAGAGPLACWMLAGLETALFALLVTAAWDAALRRATLRAGILGVLLILTRPEGPALAGLFCAWSLLPIERDSRIPVDPLWRRAIGPAILVVGAAAFFLWRHATYGWWLPNTYYAKTGDLAGQLSSGLPYGRSFLLRFGLPLLGAAAVAALRSCATVLRSREMYLGLGVMLFWSAYVVVIGGDTLGMFRFFVPLLPLLVTWSVAALASCGWLDRPARAIVIAVLLGAALLPTSFQGREQWLVRTHMKEANLGGWMLAGDAMAAQLPAGSSVALGPAGYIPWRTGFVTWDYFGIVTPHIAHKKMEFQAGNAGHEKHDGPWIVSRRPDYVLIGNVDITPQPRQGLMPMLAVEREIVLDPVFQRSYEMISLPLADGQYVNLFARRDRRR